MATWVEICKPCQQDRHASCTGNCDCAMNDHNKKKR